MKGLEIYHYYVYTPNNPLLAPCPIFPPSAKAPPVSAKAPLVFLPPAGRPNATVPRRMGPNNYNNRIGAKLPVPARPLGH